MVHFLPKLTYKESGQWSNVGIDPIYLNLYESHFKNEFSISSKTSISLGLYSIWNTEHLKEGNTQP